MVTRTLLSERIMLPLKKALLLNEHVLIGVSPFNSYFSESNLSKILSWGLSNFKDMHVFIPDKISTYTLQAIGYPAERARKKTKKQDHYLRNKVIRAFLNNGLPISIIEKRIVLLSDLSSNPEYKEIYNTCLELYKTNHFFRAVAFLPLGGIIR